MADAYTIDWPWVSKQVERTERIGRAKNSAAGKVSAKALAETIEKAKSLARPSQIVLEKNILSIKPDSIELEDSLRISGSRLSSYLKGSSSAHFFLATIGRNLEDEATRLMKQGRELEGYLLDRIGSFAVESLAENIEKQIRVISESKKMSASTRYSPGYCDWPIEEQTLLTDILDFSGIGVTLTENFMMAPKKTISGLVAVGPEGTFSKARSQCADCDEADCGHRRP